MTLPFLDDDRDELSDADVVVRMLYFCEEPRLRSQIMSHCRIDALRFKRFSEHCIKRGILKLASIDYGLEAFVITDRGKGVLATTREIIGILGITSDPTRVEITAVCEFLSLV